MSVGDRLLELAHTDERAVLFTVVEGTQPGARLLVLLDRDETVGDAPATLAALAPEIRRNGMHEVEGLKVFVDATSAQYLKGAVVDYVETLEGAGFKFENPNVKTTCGCGSSFSM